MVGFLFTGKNTGFDPFLKKAKKFHPVDGRYPDISAQNLKLVLLRLSNLKLFLSFYGLKSREKFFVYYPNKQNKQLPLETEVVK